MGYAPYRACVHKLLEPVVANLDAIATAIRRTARPEMTAACTKAIDETATFYDSYSENITGLLAGFDDDARAAQVKSSKDYFPLLGRLSRRFDSPLADLTQPCYSPEDLASINASPSASR